MHLRVFFAIKLPKTMDDFFLQWLQLLKQSAPEHLLRWSRVENLHVTLQFIKSIEAEHVPLLIDRVQSELEVWTTFQLEFGPLEWFPNPQKPKVLSLSVGPENQMKALATSIGNAIESLHYPLENKPFRGHLTLGRLTNFTMPILPVIQYPLPPIPSVSIDDVYLIESRPSRGRTNYHPLVSIHLNAS